MLTGFKTIDGNSYYMMDSQHANFTTSKQGRIVTGFNKIKNATYYFDSNGVEKFGWQQIDGDWYYFIDSRYVAYKDSNKGQMVTGFKTIGGKKYYFKSNGVQVKANGAVSINGSLYLINRDGEVTSKTGWVKYGDDWYYVLSGCKLKTGWLTVGGASYYLDTGNAKMYTGIRRVDGSLYFFASNGQRASSEGWKTFNGNNRYTYTYSNGTVAVGKSVDGYKIGNDGRAVKINNNSSMDEKADGYSSNTNYLIMINTSTHKIGVYKGSRGNWTRKTYESCADGAGSTPTDTGTFTTSRGSQSEDSAGYTHWYLTHLSNGSDIWSVPCYQGTKNVANGTLGAAIDGQGCVRVSLDTAEWLYDMPAGTKVVIY